MNRFPESCRAGNQALILLENADDRKACLNAGMLLKNPSQLYGTLLGTLQSQHLLHENPKLLGTPAPFQISPSAGCQGLK